MTIPGFSGVYNMLAVKRQGDADFSRGPNYDESCIRCMENINTYDGDEQV